MSRPSRIHPFSLPLATLLLCCLLPPALASAQGPSSEIAFATFLGGSLWDEARDLAVDAGGNVWVTGTTASRDFPAAGEPPEPLSSITEPTDGFLVRLSRAGDLLASDYVGSELNDDVRAIALDHSGNPWETGAADRQPATGVLLAQGASAFVYNRFGIFFEDGRDIAFDGAGNVYVLARTDDDFGFDFFVDKRSPQGDDLYASILSGDAQDDPQALAVDGTGVAYVLANNSDFFKLDPAGETVPFTPQLTGLPSIADIAADPAGDLHVVGTRAGQLFYARLSPQGQVLASLDFGGSDGDFGRRIALGPAGDVALLGLTLSPDLPLVAPVATACLPDAGQPGCRLTPFVVRLVGTTVVFSSYLEIDLLSGMGEATTVGLGPEGDLYVAGWTRDPAFPTVNAVQPALNGPMDAFVLRITTNQPPACGRATVRPATLWPANGKLVPVAIQGITDLDGGAVAVTVTSLRQDEPLAAGTPDGTGVGTATPRVRAARSGKSDGRVYTIGFEARDTEGAACTGVVKVCVPHDQGRRRVCGDGGALVDSTGG